MVKTRRYKNGATYSILPSYLDATGKDPARDTDPSLDLFNINSYITPPPPVDDLLNSDNYEASSRKKVDFEFTPISTSESASASASASTP